VGEQSLAVEIREETGKGQARRLRDAGKIPAVLYGHGNAPVSLTLISADLESLVKRSDAGVNTLIDLAGTDALKGRIVLIKEIQRHPVRGDLVHLDLYEIDASEKIHVTVPIHLTGTPSGVKLGGMLEHAIREIDMFCLPQAIPDSLDLDVSALELGDSVHVSDLTLPEGTEISLEDSTTVAHVIIPKAVVAEETEEVAEGEEGAEATEEGEAEEKDEKSE
jgi:large subunit ribosomal protein L25